MPLPLPKPALSGLAASHTLPGDGVKLSQEQQKAVDTITSLENRVCILTGQAGSGKSTVTNHLRNLGWFACATTGKAAMHIQGPTVDSLFCLSREDWSIWSEDFLYRNMLNIPDNIIIDEASMVGRKMGDLIHNIIMRGEFRKNLLLVGDWAQASPVKDDLLLSSKLLTGGYTFVKLEENHRQSDGVFMSALNEMRSGQLTGKTSDLFKSRIVATPPDDDRYIRMYATNKKTDAYNNARLYRHVADTNAALFRIFTNFEDKRKEATQKQYPRSESYQTKAIQQSIFGHGEALAVGCRALLTTNQMGQGYVNGDTGTLTEAVSFDGRPLAKCVAEYEESGRNFRIQTIRIRLDRTNEEVSVHHQEKEIKDATGWFTQHVLGGFPLRLGYACTIHKAQGMTVDKAWVDVASLQKFPDNESRHGLAYVALSRTRTLEGLLLGSWDSEMIYCNPDIRELL